MTVSFNKLFKLLIDRGIKKGELAASAGISVSSISKLGRGENVNIGILIKICQELNCTMDDIMRFPPKSLDEYERLQVQKEFVEVS